MSRSNRAPHFSQVKTVSARRSLAFTAPQVEQVFEEVVRGIARAELAVELTLQAPQPLERRLQWPRVREHLTRAQGGQAPEPEIDTPTAAGSRARRIFGDRTTVKLTYHLSPCRCTVARWIRARSSSARSV